MIVGAVFLLSGSDRAARVQTFLAGQARIFGLL